MSTTEMKKSKNLHTIDSEQSIFLQNKKQKADLIKPTLFCSSKEKNQSNNAQDIQTKKRLRHCNDEVIHSNHIKKKQTIDAKLDKMFRNNQTENNILNETIPRNTTFNDIVFVLETSPCIYPAILQIKQNVEHIVSEYFNMFPNLRMGFISCKENLDLTSDKSAILDYIKNIHSQIVDKENIKVLKSYFELNSSKDALDAL
jgi:hypothetical protein